MQNKIVEGSVVSYFYTLKNSNGEIVEQVSAAPVSSLFLKEKNSANDGIVKAMAGRSEGERFTLKLKPQEAYGEYDPNGIMFFERGEKRFQINEPVHFVVRGKKHKGRVVEVSEDSIKVDCNHPMAGQNVEIDVEIVRVRPATPVEKKKKIVQSVFQGVSPMEIETDESKFPYDLMNFRKFPGKIGKTLEKLERYSGTPPFPWGQWLYSEIFESQLNKLGGDVIELGVATGGMSMFLAEIAKKNGKKVYSLDSFEGLPSPNPKKDRSGFQQGDYKGADRLENPLVRFQNALKKFDLSDTVVPIQGYFDKTIPKMKDDLKFCFAHIDCNLYDSITLSLNYVYDRMVTGGVIVVDDFFHHGQGPSKALADFLTLKNIHPILHVSFPYAVFFIKGEFAPSLEYRSLDGNCYSFEYLKRDKLFLKELDKSIVRARKNPVVYARALAFKKILKNKNYSNSDIYRYWELMEDFWDGFVGQGISKTRVRI